MIASPARGAAQEATPEPQGATPEAQVVYRLSVAADGGRIVYEFGSQQGSVRPIGNDTFWRNNRQFRFERAADGTITGFQLDAGRVKNLRFTRVP